MRLRNRIFSSPLQTLRALSYYCLGAAYDLRLGIDTGKPSAANQSHPHDPSSCNNRYDPTEPKYIRWMFRNLPDPRSYTFIDFGAGKGRVLVAAARYPFKKVIGVEVSAELAEISRQNIAKANCLKCGKVASVCIDATDFAIPDDPLVCFFYNPFGSQIMRAVLENISNSLRLNPRPAFAVYVNPKHRELFNGSGFRRVLQSYWCRELQYYWCEMYSWAG
jgi:predicted RNA methylase